MWFTIQNDQVKINIFAKPNAKKTAIIGFSQQEIHISLHAKPDQGEANDELIAYLAQSIRIPKSQIILQRGQRGRHKQVVMPLTEKVHKWLNENVKNANSG